uniref:Uncharacterized protein n=1 Tax=Octopus bimaculoides TaxID=37653 RepID=A0A0L8FRE1_OCTBM
MLLQIRDRSTKFHTITQPIILMKRKALNDVMNTLLYYFIGFRLWAVVLLEHKNDEG